MRQVINEPLTSPEESSPLRAWLNLVWLSILQQGRMRQMVWIALILLTISAAVLGFNNARGRTGMAYWRWFWTSVPQERGFIFPTGKNESVQKKPSIYGPDGRLLGVVSTYTETVEAMELLSNILPWPAPASVLQYRIADAWRRSLSETGFFVYSNWFVFTIFIGFLLPIWCLSFATEAIGGERENRSLVWLLTRPLPRSSIYLAKFLGLLPWSIGFCVGGFGVLCFFAGHAGLLAFSLYWPTVACGTVAFCSLFHLLAVVVRRSAVIGLVYAFFLEMILGMMPGYMKRVSLSFYIRCAMFDAAQDYSIHPEKPSIYLPVDGFTAWSVMLGVTAVSLLLGMIIFAKTEYQDLA